MIPAHWSSLLANHLWQSTAFAAGAGLLALVLRKNRAQVRYRLWLISSVKFLIPFSLFVGLGGLIGTGSHIAPKTAPIGQTQWTYVQEISQPFTQATVPRRAMAAAVDTSNPVPMILLTVWLCGFIAVTFRWWRQWRRVRAMVQSATPVRLTAEIEVRSSPELIEPGIFGIFRPVLLLPEGITEHLTPLQLKAVLAHELCHVRRRDNLHAAMHMVAEAIFWFHPLVWWVGARLIEERERACDEEVLRQGSEPHVYAESILKTCQFYLESPLACMSGITGSDLKKRVVHIMTQSFSHKLDRGRKLLLTSAATAAIAGPIVFGLLNVSQSRAQVPAPGEKPTFEVASIKPSNASGPGPFMIMNGPGTFRANGITLKMLIRLAYHVQDRQITGGPAWMNSERFSIEAKVPGGGGDLRKMTDKQREAEWEKRRLMMQALLEERFQLKVQREPKELPIYALVVAKGGPKLKEVPEPQLGAPGAPDGPPKGDMPRVRAGDPPPPPPPPGAHVGEGIRMGRGDLSGTAAQLNMLTETLSNQLDRPVVDQTGLKGHYDFDLKWTPEPGQGQMFKGPGGPGGPGAPADAPPAPDSTGPSIFTAIQEQLGLKLEATKAPVDVLVIDHAEKPSEN